MPPQKSPKSLRINMRDSEPPPIIYDEPPPIIPDVDERSGLKQAWDWANKPLWTAPAEKGKEISDAIGPGFVSQATAADPGKLFKHQLKEFAAGIPQGIGDLVSGFTSPLNLVTGAAFGGAGMAARGGLGLTAKVLPRAGALFTPKPNVATGLTRIGKALSAPIVAEGAINTAHPDSTIQERAFGLIQMAGGGTGLAAPKPRVSRTTVGTTGIPRTPVTPESVRRAKNVIDNAQGNLKRIAGMADEEIVSFAEQVDPTWKPTLEEGTVSKSNKGKGKKGKEEAPTVTVDEDAPEVIVSSDGKLIDVKTGNVLAEVPGAVKPPVKGTVAPPVKPPVLPPDVPPTSDVIPPPTKPTGDPNFTGGEGNPELAGSTPYSATTGTFADEVLAATPERDFTKEHPLTGDFIQQQNVRTWRNSSNKEVKEVAESLIRRRASDPDMKPQYGEDLILDEYRRRGLEPESVAEQLMTQHGDDYDPFAVTSPGKGNLVQGKFEGMPGSKTFDEMAQHYDDQITTEGGRQSQEMMPDIERELFGGNKGDISGEVNDAFDSLPDKLKPGIIKPQDWGDWGGAEKDLPTLVPDETGSHVARQADEVLPAEPELDMFGIPKNRDLTDAEVAKLKSQFENDVMQSYGEDTVEGQRAVDEINGIIDVPPSSIKHSVTNREMFDNSRLLTEGEKPPISPQQRTTDQHVRLEDTVRNRPGQELLDRMEAEGLLQKPGVEAEVNQAFGRVDEPQFSRAYDDDLFKGSEGKGLGKKSFDEQWQDSVREAEILGIDWKAYDNLDDLQWHITKAAAQETIKTGKNPLAQLTDESGNEPQFAKIGDKRGQISVNVKRSAQELTTGYSRELPGIMVREGLQNAIDAIRTVSKTNGEMTLKIGDDYLEIGDNGIGMSPDELFTVYTNLHETGKMSDTGAAGGKGVGKASYMLGGSNFKVITVKDVNGKKIRSTFGGTPDELLGGFDVESHPVSPETRTGTWFRTDLPNTTNSWAMRSMFNDVVNHSRDIDIKFKTDNYDSNNWDEVSFKSKANDKSIAKAKMDGGNDDVEILIPQGSNLENRNNIRVHYLNKGLYQFSDYMYLDEATNGIPDHILVDIAPLVEEGSPSYPFPVQRESIKASLKTEIEQRIKDDLINPFKNKRKTDLVKLWNSMAPVASTKTGREVVLFDPGDRLTPTELMDFQTSPVFSKISELVDTMIDDMLLRTGTQAWQEKVTRVGIMLSEPGYYGVHIPNPGAAKGVESAILVNPFAHFNEVITNRSVLPGDAALDTVVTALHEVAHVGTENPTTLARITDADLNDPRVGRYLKSYMEQMQSQGGLDMGHGWAFAHRLGNIFAKFGTKRGLNAAASLEQLIKDPLTGGYSPEIQRLLRIYTDSRRRPAVTEDILSPTGVKSEAKQGGKGSIPGDNNADGRRVPPSNRPPTISVREPTPAKIEMLKQLGYIPGGTGPDGFPVMKLGTPQQIAAKGKLPKVLVPFNDQIHVKNPTQAVIKRLKEQGFKLTDLKADGTGTFEYVRKEPPKKASAMRELFNLPRGMTTTADISAPMRQGLPLIATKAWWTSWDDMLKSLGSEQAYQNVISDIEGKELFKPRFNPRTGTVEKSFAAEAGIKLSDLKALGNREESIMSTWVENIPGFGRIARGSNRAYTAFLNKLRADTFTSLIDDATNMGLDPRTNLVLAREIADFVNTATGRGPMKTALPNINENWRPGWKERDIERHAELLTNTLFSPRLVASRVRMLNPGTYIMASPFVRKQYLKALLSTAAAWSTMAGLAYGAGADVSFDTNSADFGKIKLGNTRIDPAGGFQQYLVAVSRFATGKHTSSGSGREFELGKGFKAETRWSVAERFAVNKLHPVWKFGYDLFTASQYKPFNLMDRTAQLFVPLIVQDAMEIAQEDPTLLPLLLPVATGMGTQTYEKGSSDSKFTPFLGIEDLDIKFGGGNQF